MSEYKFMIPDYTELTETSSKII